MKAQQIPSSDSRTWPTVQVPIPHGPDCRQIYYDWRTGGELDSPRFANPLTEAEIRKSIAATEAAIIAESRLD